MKTNAETPVVLQGDIIAAGTGLVQHQTLELICIGHDMIGA